MEDRQRLVSGDTGAEAPYLLDRAIDNGRIQLDGDLYSDDDDDEDEHVSDYVKNSADKRIKKRYRPRLAMAVVPCFLFFISMFVMIPVCAQLQIAFVCQAIQGGEDCDNAHVSARTGRIALITQLAQSIPAFLLAGTYASIANRYGRRICLIIPMLGSAVFALILLAILWATNNGKHFSISELTLYLTGGSILLGLSGSYSVFQMASFSYAADITNKNMAKRGLIYTLLEASLFLGKAIGPPCAGFYAQSFGFAGPLMCVIMCCLFGILWCVFAVRETDSYPKYENKIIYNPFHTFHNIALLWGKTVEQEKAAWEKSQSVDPLSMIEDDDDGSEREKEGSDSRRSKEETCSGTFACTGSPMPFVSVAIYFYFAAFSGNISVWYLFITHTLNWGPDLIGTYDAFEGFMQFLAMTLVPWLIVKACGRYVDIYWLLVGYVTKAVHFVLLGLVGSTTDVFAIAPLMIFSAVITPRTRSIVSQCVTKEEQAAVLSGFSAMQGSAQFLAPLFVYGYTLSVYTAPYAMYLAFSACCAAGALSVLCVLCTPSIRKRLPATPNGSSGGSSSSSSANSKDAAAEAGGGVRSPLLANRTMS
jgi:MFS family permease